MLEVFRRYPEMQRTNMEDGVASRGRDVQVRVAAYALAELASRPRDA